MFIIPTEFRDLKSNKLSYGFRAWNEESTLYNDTIDSLENISFSDDLSFLEYVLENCMEEALEKMLDEVIQNREGILIGDNSYSCDEVRPILEKYTPE